MGKLNSNKLPWIFWQRNKICSVPQIFMQYFAKACDVYTYLIRNAKTKIFIPRTQLVSTNHFVKATATKLWNALPQTI